MTWADKKRRKDNPYYPKLDDYENDSWMALCTLKNEQPNTLARIAMLAYLEQCERELDDLDNAATGTRNQCA
ncbi:hypothetical protein ACTXGL_01530 [Psychrobacter sp. T6-6]|uniref:hypothetical protein n=1 Tax=Psychrobacter sp. T6-6 TaxID=3457452 RepID=UPI003FD5BCCD